MSKSFGWATMVYMTIPLIEIKNQGHNNYEKAAFREIPGARTPSLLL